MTDQNQNSYNKESRGIAMNIFAVLGFVAILLAGLWATIQLVKQLPNITSGFNIPTITMPIFGDKDRLAIVENDGVLRSGESAKITWTLGQKEREAQGSIITLSYACKPGMYLRVANMSMTEYRAIPCNAPYNIPASQAEISIIPILTDIETGEILYSLTYTTITGESQSVNGILKISNEGELAQVVDTEKKEEVETVKEEGAVVTTDTIVQAPVQKTTVIRKLVPVRKSDPNGLPDLAIKILEVGAVRADGKVPVRFEIANIGTRLVSNWTLTANLPTDPTYTYVSDAQGILYAGERAEMVLTFDKLQTGTNALTIIVDAQNAIHESMETNNSVAQSIIGR